MSLFDSRPQCASQKGRRAENLALLHLQDKGFRLESRNVKLGRGELDLIMWDGEILVFVEVKGRRKVVGSRRGSVPAAAADPGHTSEPEAGLWVESVDQNKRERLISAAEAYLARRPRSCPPCRFDVVTVRLGVRAEVVGHLIDAFRPGD